MLMTITIIIILVVMQKLLTGNYRFLDSNPQNTPLYIRTQILYLSCLAFILFETNFIRKPHLMPVSKLSLDICIGYHGDILISQVTW